MTPELHASSPQAECLKFLILRLQRIRKDIPPGWFCFFFFSLSFFFFFFFLLSLLAVRLSQNQASSPTVSATAPIPKLYWDFTEHCLNVTWAHLKQGMEKTQTVMTPSTSRSPTGGSPQHQPVCQVAEADYMVHSNICFVDKWPYRLTFKRKKQDRGTTETMKRNGNTINLTSSNLILLVFSP